MIRIDIGTINIQFVTQAGSVNIGNTLHVVEKPGTPSSPGRDRGSTSDPSPEQRFAGHKKEAAEVVDRRRRGGAPPSGYKAFSPGTARPFIWVPGWIPVLLIR